MAAVAAASGTLRSVSPYVISSVTTKGLRKFRQQSDLNWIRILWKARWAIGSRRRCQR